MLTEDVKRINTAVMDALKREVAITGCGCCDCRIKHTKEILSQHQPIEDKGNVWNLLTVNEQKIIQHYQNKPYNEWKYTGGHTCCGP